MSIEEPTSPPELRLVDLPPPGNARRRVLREFGISITRSDFTDEELAERRMAIDGLHAGSERRDDA